MAHFKFQFNNKAYEKKFLMKETDGSMSISIRKVSLYLINLIQLYNIHIVVGILLFQ